MGVVEVSATTKPGDVLATISLNPRAWKGSRICQQSQVFARWRPQNIKVLVQPTCAATSAGAIAVFWSPDPVDQMGKSGPANVVRGLSYPTSRLLQVWQSGSLSIPCNVSQKWLFLEGPETCDTEHGVLKVVCVAPYVGTGSVGVVLSLEYSYILEGADIKDSGQAGDGDVQPRFPGIFTTSVSDLFSGTVLVFKYRSGGEAAGFPRANSASYYKLSDSAKVQYYDKDGKLQDAKYFVVVSNYTNNDGDRILAPVASEAHAKAYLGKPDKSYLLVYYSAGPYATPDEPVFHPVSTSLELLAPKPGQKVSELRLEDLVLN